MKSRLNRTDRLVVLRIVSIYAFFSGLWIYLSDSILGVLIQEPAIMTRYSVYKGFLFIAVTVALLYKLIARYVERTKQADEALQKAHDELELRVVQRTEELDGSRVELETQNRKLLETYRELEMETTKRIRTMEELREKDTMLIQQSRMAAMGEMLGNIAHQWRQPLNRLGLKVQQLGMLREDGELNKDVLDESIHKIMEIILHLSRTIDDFRHFSLPDKEKEIFNVGHVITRTISLVEESFREHQIAIEIDNATEVQASGYPNEYAQVLLNILMNARDALLERGTIDARVTIRSFVENGRAVVTIGDNAGGIRDEIIGKVFDAYFTTKDLGKGTGVGLFMSKNIIEKNMGGRLMVYNKNNGAEFRIEI